MQTERAEVSLREGESHKLSLVDNFGSGVACGEVEIVYRGNELKLLFSVKDGDIISFGTRYNEPLWKGDTAELFLSLGRDTRYLELEVNPDGVLYAAVVENGGDGMFELEFLSDPPFEAETERTAAGYRSRWTIGLDKLIDFGFDIACVRFNAFVQDYTREGLKLYAAFPTMLNTFHVPRAFGRLVLKDK